MSARTIRLSDNSSWRLSLGLQFCHPTNYRKVDEDQMALLKNGLGWWSFNSERNFQAYVGKVHAILERIWDLFIYALNVGKKKEHVEGKEGSTVHKYGREDQISERRKESKFFLLLPWCEFSNFLSSFFCLGRRKKKQLGNKVLSMYNFSEFLCQWMTNFKNVTNTGSLADIPVIL